MNSFLLPTWTLLQRDVVRFLRQRSRIIGAFGTPIVFWLLIGSGLGRSFRTTGTAGMNGGLNYLQYFFPGTVALILLFTAIFSTISIIEDRREGFLQGVLAAPVPRSAIVWGKLLGGTVLAFVQGVLFVGLAPFLGIHMGFSDLALVLLIIFFMSIGLTGLGFIIAWKMDSTQGFHSIMNLFLLPMWFLSGSLFPAEGAPLWLRIVMKLNPLTYSVAGLHQGFFHHASSATRTMPSIAACLWATILFAAATAWIATAVASQTETSGKVRV